MHTHTRTYTHCCQLFFVTSTNNLAPEMPARDKKHALPGGENTSNANITRPSMQKQVAPPPKGPVVPIDGIGQDMPTAMIAPEDYVHIYKKDGTGVSGKAMAANLVDLDRRSSQAKVGNDNFEPMPTAFIAPEDYQHVFHKPEGGVPAATRPSFEKKNSQPARHSAERKASRQSMDRRTIKRQVSEKRVTEDIGKAMPTAMIAPDDYQHVFHKSRNNETAPSPTQAAQGSDKKVSTPELVCQPMPTAFIAPEDYQHIFHKPKPEEAPQTPAQVARQSSDNNKSTSNTKQTRATERTNDDDSSPSNLTFKAKNQPGVGLLLREQDVEEELGLCLRRKWTDNRKSKHKPRKPSIKIKERQVDMHSGFNLPMSLVTAIEQLVKTFAADKATAPGAEEDKKSKESKRKGSSHRKDKKSRHRKR